MALSERRLTVAEYREYCALWRRARGFQRLGIKLNPPLQNIQHFELQFLRVFVAEKGELGNV